MSINFTGIKNVGAISAVIPQTGNQVLTMSLQVTNDENGNDLDEFKKTLDKVSNPEQFKLSYEGLISVDVGKNLQNEYEEDYMPEENIFYLNGSPLKINDENLPIFTYLAKLTRKIADKKNNKMPVEDSYFLKKDFIYGTSLGYYVRKVYSANPNINLSAMIRTMHHPENAKMGADAINQSIQSSMEDYLG